MKRYGARRGGFRAEGLALGIALAGLSGSALLQAQGNALGIFRWQLQPYCNVLTLTVVQLDATFELEGSDDQCGQSRMASVVGLAFPNPDGSIGAGLTIVTAPGATPIHVDAAIALASLRGTWRDSAGNSGEFVPVAAPATGYLATDTLGSDGLVVGAFSPAGVPTTTVVHCGVVDCTTGTVTTTGLTGEAPMLVVGPGGLPVIATYTFSPRQVHVTFCGNPSCSAGNVTVDAAGVQASALTATPDGRVAAWLYDSFTFTSIVRAVCDTAGCSPPAATGLAANARVVRNGADGIPIGLETSGQSLVVWRCSDLACTTAGRAIAEPSATNYVGWDPSIVIAADGLPIVAHWDLTAGALRVTTCHDVGCDGINESSAVDDPDDAVGQTPSIAFGADGFPVIAHRDLTAQRLRITKCWSRTCQ